MQFFISILAFLSALVTALPTASNDGRGATIYTEKNFKGQSTAIPANNWCTDLDDIFGDFDGKVRSIKVEKGYRCQFYTTYDCPANGQKLKIGSNDSALFIGDLISYDQKIHSAYCTRM